ncbi:hypothetical protein ACL9RL_14370 [Plantibacter sp. Mn2098]|uniref:hypothetical protein n=1 Tax=Plantibacter sp. Mn2098 TaxID=3395266 RepID=UPI003BE29A44
MSGTTTRALSPIAAHIRPGYWRITATDGRVIGNIEESASTEGGPFLARRFVAASVSYAQLGRFHDMSDAIDAFRA